jgi:hypothetical protein
MGRDNRASSEELRQGIGIAKGLLAAAARLMT